LRSCHCWDDKNGICIFCDGPGHDLPQRKETDAQERGKLEDSGFRVIAIRHDSSAVEQIAEHSDIFGPGDKTASVT
jgi:hypothetical protein